MHEKITIKKKLVIKDLGHEGSGKANFYRKNSKTAISDQITLYYGEFSNLSACKVLTSFFT